MSCNVIHDLPTGTVMEVITAMYKFNNTVNEYDSSNRDRVARMLDWFVQHNPEISKILEDNKNVSNE